MTTPSPIRIAVDIGGTFTDSVLMVGEDATPATAKTLTTHDNPTRGALAGVRRVVYSSSSAVYGALLLSAGTGPDYGQRLKQIVHLGLDLDPAEIGLPTK